MRNKKKKKKKWNKKKQKQMCRETRPLDLGVTDLRKEGGGEGNCPGGKEKLVVMVCKGNKNMGEERLDKGQIERC